MTFKEHFERFEEEKLKQIELMGLNIEYQKFQEPLFKIQVNNWYRINYFEMDADARQSLKWMTFRRHGYGGVYIGAGTYSHCVWYEDWF